MIDAVRERLRGVSVIALLYIVFVCVEGGAGRSARRMGWGYRIDRGICKLDRVLNRG